MGKHPKHGRNSASFYTNSHFIMSFKLKVCPGQLLAFGSQGSYHVLVYKLLICDSGYNSYL